MFCAFHFFYYFFFFLHWLVGGVDVHISKMCCADLLVQQVRWYIGILTGENGHQNKRTAHKRKRTRDSHVYKRLICFQQACFVSVLFLDVSASGVFVLTLTLTFVTCVELREPSS